MFFAFSQILIFYFIFLINHSLWNFSVSLKNKEKYFSVILDYHCGFICKYLSVIISVISVSFQCHKNFQCDFQCNNFIVIAIPIHIALLIPWIKSSGLTAHNWQKWKRVFLTCPCHKIYRDEAVGLKSCKYTWKNYDFCENVKFGAISWKFDILSIAAYEFKNSFAHVWHI